MDVQSCAVPLSPALSAGSAAGKDFTRDRIKANEMRLLENVEWRDEEVRFKKQIDVYTKREMWKY
jgi:hypothetical protein